MELLALLKDLVDFCLQFEFGRYLAAGGASMIVSHAVFIALSLMLGRRFWICTIGAFIPYVILNYWLQTRYAFHVENAWPWGTILFFAKEAAFIPINVWLLESLDRLLRDRQIFNQVFIATPTQSVASYALTHLIFGIQQ